MLPSETEIEDPEPFSIEDEKFDRIFPAAIRRLSSLFWTPVAVAAGAAELLVTAPGVRVLDIGCGPGKFCLVGASVTDGQFTGVEQRPELLTAASRAAEALHLTNVEFVQANITEIVFAEFNAFYLFNPFEENMHGHKIDSDVPLSPALFKRYTRHVSDQLGRMPLGTRVVSYAGYGDEVPACYDCELALFRDDLKLWIKHRDYDPDAEELGLVARRSYRGSAGWAPPR